MLRKSFAFVCTLFALLFVFGLSARSHAAVVNASGGFMGADNTSVAFFVRGSDVTNVGQVSLTTRSAHYYANITSLSITSTNIAWNAAVTDVGSTTVITGTLTRPSATAAWTVSCTVYVNGAMVSAYTAPFRGQVLIN